MGKAAKAHRAKVAKRNANMKVQEKKMKKLWQEAFEEQMKVMREKFENSSGSTENNDFIDEDSKNELKQMLEDNFKDLNLTDEIFKNEETSKTEDLTDLKEKIKSEFLNMEDKNMVEEDFNKLFNLIENSENKKSKEESEPTEPVSGE